MKKLLLAFISVALFYGISKAENYLYNVQPSTYPITESATLSPDINQSKVKVKQIVIYQSSDTVQTVSIYKNASSTTTITKVADFPVPGAVGYYYPLSNSVISQSLIGDVDFIDVPYIAIRTDEETNPVQVSVIYK